MNLGGRRNILWVGGVGTKTWGTKLGWVGLSVCERVHEHFALCVKFAHARNMSQNTATDRIKTRTPYKPCTGTDHSQKSTCHVTTRVHYVHAAYARVRHSLGQQTAEQTFSYKNESLNLLFWSVHKVKIISLLFHYRRKKVVDAVQSESNLQRGPKK